MIAALWALSALATVLAWIVARERREHRPIAWLLAYGLATDAIREAIGAFVLRPARVTLAGAPFTGWVRVAFHIESALFVGWMAGIAAMSVYSFTRRRPWGVLAAYLVAVAVLTAGYPMIRGELLGRVYLGLELTSLCVAFGCLVLWFVGDQRGKTHHLAAGFIIVAEMTMLVGPFRMGVFTAWDLARSILIALYISLIPVQGVALWRRTS